MRIISSALISHQDTYKKEAFSEVISQETYLESVLHPEYKDIIPPMERRRMTDAVKMGLACTKACLDNFSEITPGAIIVGTSMGSSAHTLKFLDSIITSNGGLISPTPFIQSTHNTIAGQISLFLKNNRYNNTHTQNSLSFEHALFDAYLLDREGVDHILFGSSDESENVLFDLFYYLRAKKHVKKGAGAAFFLTSKQENTDENIVVKSVEPNSNVVDTHSILSSFLDKNEKTMDDLDLILYSSYSNNIPEDLVAFPENKLVDYTSLCGDYFTNSGFAFGYAIDLLKHRPTVKSILVYNNLVETNLGLTLIEKH
ncbi:MAG: hypothetical protein EP333_02790 [Bacteroidetes bacterium]|nr:MAG: hypothetical protein EP333_02790 [Bacteroidota bacterium]